MKKIITLSLMAFSLYAGTCPDLSRTEANKDVSAGIKEALDKTLPNLSIVFQDSLKSYNKTEDINKYILDKNLQEIGATYTWGELIKVKYKLADLKENKNVVIINDKVISPNQEEIEKLEKEYKRILMKITPENKNWCEAEGLK